MDKIQREKILASMVKDKSISKSDKSLYRFIIGLSIKGANLKKVIRWTGVSQKKAKVWFDNLKKNGYFEGEKIVLEESKRMPDLPYHLMATVALGFLKRVQK